MKLSKPYQFHINSILPKRIILLNFNLSYRILNISDKLIFKLIII